MKFIPHLIFLLTACSLIADEKAEKLLNLAGFTSHSSKNLQLSGFGSGFAVTSDGYLVTASHVTEGSDAVRVIFKDGKSYDAKVVKEERGLDLAILKIEAKTPAFLSVSSRTAELGDDIYTIGYPSPLLLGTNQKFTKGSISALTGLKNDSFRYQISVPIQPGNSGGAVVSEETGEVVGIVVSSLKGKEVVGFTPQSVNYALKSVFVRPILDALEIKSVEVKVPASKNSMRQRVSDAACMIVTANQPANQWNKKISELELLKWENSRLSLKIKTVNGASLVMDKKTGLWHHDVAREPFTGRVFEEYPNRYPRAEGTFLDGKKDGMERFWYPNGNLKIEGQWIDGKQNGVFREWNESGQLYRAARYKNGQLIEKLGL